MAYLLNDINCAYLNAKLDTDIPMSQTNVFVHNNYKNYICKLKKAMYGLHE